MSKPTILMAFAANNLDNIQKEADKIWNSVSSSDLVTATKIENAGIEDLAGAIIDANDLFMFHFGGHADQGSIVLEGMQMVDKIRLSRILSTAEQLQLVFLNGCLSYGHVGIMTAKGVKAMIATNVKVNDGEAARIAAFFYKLFFEKGYTLRKAFETAEATVSGKNSFPIIVNPGEIDENQAMPASWTLFIHGDYKDVIDWTLQDFLPRKNAAKTSGGPDPKLPPKEKIRFWVKNGNLSEALDQLQLLLPEEENSIIGLQSRVSRLNRSEMDGVIDAANANVERNKLVKGILDMLNMAD